MLKNYFKPTPVLFRKIGDTCLIVSSTISGWGILSEHKDVAIIGLVLAVAGKILTNFFTDEKDGEVLSKSPGGEGQEGGV